MSAHTPGPWEVEDIENVGFDVVHRFVEVRGNATEQKIAQVYGGNQDEERGNARLIAAAPDLLAALEMLLADPHSLEDIANGKRMVAKARGVS